jgi:DNA uptake protein ComE-like DNA-binding protein
MAAEPGSFVWTRRQRSVLASLVLILCAFYFVKALRNPAHVDDPPAPEGSRAGDLATRIDPNTADWPAWAALPLIGEKRAKEIVTFREAWLADHPDQVPFEKPEDLTRVKGIGKATLETLKPYLIFPAGEESAP